MKLAIYKVFIRPKLEYGAPLISGWIAANPTRRKHWDSLNGFHQEVMKWILPMANWRVASALLAAPTPEDRFQGLACSFVQHMGKMADRHPARYLLQDWSKRLPWVDSVLLPRLAKSKLFVKLSRITVGGKAVRLAVALKDWYLNSLTQNSKLAKLISKKCRVGRYGPDSCLFIEDDAVRKIALQWRCNTFSYDKQCPCGRRFVRSCVGRCLQADSNGLLPEVLTGEGHYCCLDENLNNRLYDRFANQIDHVLSRLK